MSNITRLLQQVRHTTNFVGRTSKNPEHQAMLSYSDAILNELLLQETPDFYLEHITGGKKLLSEGRELASRNGRQTGSVTLRDDLHAELRNAVFDEQIQLLNDALVDVVNTLDKKNSDAEKDFLGRVSDWAESLFQHRGQRVDDTIRDTVKPVTEEMVLSYLGKKHPDWKGLKINEYTTLYGGFSKQTIVFDTEDEMNGQQSIVLRIEQDLNVIYYPGCYVDREFYMIEFMHKHGIPVAKPLWLEEDASQLGGRFIASEKVPGVNRGDSLGGEAGLPDAVVDTMLETFYRLHSVEIDPQDPLANKSHLEEWLHCRTITEANRYNVDVFIPNEIERSGAKVSPELARVLRWAQANAPECDEPPVINHLDYSFNNLLFDGDQISAILDWETSRIGDPVDDIIWTQYGLQSHFTMDEFLARYKEATGREISEYRIAYSRVIKYLFNLIGALNGMQKLNNLDSAPVKFSLFPYKFMPLLNVGLNQLIANAEAVKNK